MAPAALRLQEFREAIHALAADPTRNVERYLAASRAIERGVLAATHPTAAKVADAR